MAARKDKRRQERARFLELYAGLGAPAGTALAQALWVILVHNGTKDGARSAVNSLWSQFVDVNEFRAASLGEIAAHLEGHVKNDPLRVAEILRGFLRRFFRDFHSMDFIAALEKTPEGLKKYLNDPEAYGQEIALAIFMRLCVAEIEAEKAEETAAEAPPEARPRSVRNAISPPSSTASGSPAPVPPTARCRAR